MSNLEPYIFIFICSIFVALFARLLLINFQFINYMKANHKEFYEETYKLNWGRGLHFPKEMKKTNDPMVDTFYRKKEKALKQFVITTGVVFFAVILLIYFSRQ